jgi:hypothetical protein
MAGNFVHAVVCIVISTEVHQALSDFPKIHKLNHDTGFQPASSPVMAIINLRSNPFAGIHA